VGFLLPLLQRAGMVKVIRRRNRTALRTVDVAVIKTSQKCTHTRSENASGDISRLMDWKRRHTAKQDLPVSAKQDLPRAGNLSPFLSPYLSAPLRAPSGACSPSVAGFGAAPSGSLGNEQKQKTSVEEGNGFSFNGRFLKLTPEEERQIEELIPDSYDRTIYFTGLDESLSEAPRDPVAAFLAWMKQPQAAKLRVALKLKGWIE
jgi:hypothetical protein